MNSDEHAEQFRKFIELAVLELIKKLADENKITKERVQELAKLTIELIKPGMPLDKLYLGAVKLDDKHSELAPVVYEVMKEYEEKYEKNALTSVRQLIKNGDYDSATDVVKKVLEFKVNS